MLGIKATNNFSQINKENVTAYLQQTANFFNENKEQYEKIIAHYEKTLGHRDEIIDILKTQLETK